MKKKRVKKPSSLKPEHYFVLCTGERIGSVKMLAKKLSAMDNGVYAHHANSERNDFSNWLRTCVKEPGLADKLMSATSPMEAELQVLRHLLR